VTFSQTLSVNPPRVVLVAAGAEAAPDALAAAARSGVTVTPGQEAGTLRLSVPLPPATSATVSADGSTITVAFAPEPILLPAGRAAPPAESQGGIPEGSGPGEYVIGPEDLLEINVFELPELKTTTRVLGDGTVSLPLIGVVPAAGLTKTGFEARLSELLSERFVLDPQVTIAVTEFRSRRVSVIGAVNEPGTYEMLGPRTVLQMISEAGGLTKEAGAEIIILRRSETGLADRITLDLDDLVIRGNPELNLALEPGDVVNVPVDRPIYVYVDGAVNAPGQIEGKSSRPITLLQAVSRAGGLTERASLRGVHVLRKAADGTQKRIPVNLKDIRKGKADDMVLVDGDVVVVPETFF
jgi:polysaccharide export outer membrane protein